MAQAKGKRAQAVKAAAKNLKPAAKKTINTMLKNAGKAISPTELKAINKVIKDAGGKKVPIASTAKGYVPPAQQLPTTINREDIFPIKSPRGYSMSSSSEIEQAIRVPERDVVNFQDDNLPTELITSLLFESLGANELVKFERHDTIEGTNVNYDIISNLSNIRKAFDPAALISAQKPDLSFFDIYNIKLEDKIPTNVYLRNNPKLDFTGDVNITDYVYIDERGNLVIELVNIESDEILEVELDSNGTIYRVTI